MEGKILIFSAPSGSGKSTIVNHLLGLGLPLEFSISATSRAPRGAERNGVEYYFLTTEEFERRIKASEFVEYEEVYAGCYYGTLRSEVDRIWSKGKTIVFDVDVKGGVNLKKIFGQRAMTIFVMPPSVEALRERLLNRATDTLEKIEQRLAKAEEEMSYAVNYDVVLLNDDLQTALARAEETVREFLDR